MHFRDAPSLMMRREGYLRAGYLYCPARSIRSVVADMFKTRLIESLDVRCVGIGLLMELGTL